MKTSITFSWCGIIEHLVLNPRAELEAKQKFWENQKNLLVKQTMKW